MSLVQTFPDNKDMGGNFEGAVELSSPLDK